MKHIQEITNRYVLPTIEEKTAYGYKRLDPYTKLFEERIIFLGQPIDDTVANDVMAQLLTLESMDPDKDSDGLHPNNLGKLVLGQDGPLPCTPRGIIELLRAYKIELNGANIVIIGRGVTVGRPLGLLLTRKTENATVTLCHTGTKDLTSHLINADIVIAAAGVPHLVKANMIKKGAALVDVGITRTENGLVGDIDPQVKDVAGFFSPMPGGTGPMTRAMLLTNVVESAEGNFK